jgi:hypothetical protein
MFSKATAILVPLLFTTGVLSQHEGHDTGATTMTIEHTEDEVITLTNGTTSPMLQMMYHIHYPVPHSMANGTNQEFHWELRLYNYNISTWAANTTNRVFAGLSWVNGTKTDAVWCSVNPTGNQTRDVIACYDGYLKNTTNRTAITADTINNLIWDAEKSFTNYSTVGTSKLFNMTAHFTSYFQNPNDTTDITIAQGDSMPLTYVYGWLQNGVTLRDVQQLTYNLQVPVAPEASFAKLLKSVTSVFVLFGTLALLY